MNGQTRTAGRRAWGRKPFVIATSLAAVLLAVVCFRAGSQTLYYDSDSFYMIALGLRTTGVGSLHATYPTYGYPVFVATCMGLASRDIEQTRTRVFLAQLAIYLAASLYAARVAGRVFDSARFFRGTYAVMALNPVALIHTTEVLTDLLSGVLILLALLVSLERGRPGLRIVLSFLCAGLSVAVRPANLSIVPALALLWALRGLLYRDVRTSGIFAGAAAFTLVLVPQLAVNRAVSGQWNPRDIRGLYRDQLTWGAQRLKYGTVVAPGLEPQLIYVNPFCPPGVTRPREFLQKRPIGYLATLGVHAFALFDQDLPFTYIENPKPFYRWPLSLANYVFLFLAATGIALGLNRVDRAWDRTPRTLYFVGAFLMGISYLAIYLPVAVEDRFSLPLYLLMGPASVVAFDWLSRCRPRTLLATAIAGAGFVTACVWLSLWISAQAPTLMQLARVDST